MVDLPKGTVTFLFTDIALKPCVSCAIPNSGFTARSFSIRSSQLSS